MKRILLIFIICFMGLGFGNYNLNKKASQNKNYIKIELGSAVLNVPYIKPLDFKQYEVYVSLTTSFNPTGYSGTEWAGEPNVTADWDGATNNLFMVSPTDPIQVVGLTSGTTYYVKVVAVDKSNQRSIPSIEYTAIAGDTQRSSSCVIAAFDSSAKSKAGADYVCTGTSDQNTINQAINDLPEVTLYSGTATGGTSTTILGDGTELPVQDDYYNYMYVKIISGTGSGQTRNVVDYANDETTATITVSSWDTTPDSTSVFVIYNKSGIIILTEGTFILDDSIYLISNLTLKTQGTGSIFNYSGSTDEKHLITNQNKIDGNTKIKINGLVIVGCDKCYAIYLEEVNNVIISEVTSIRNKYAMELRAATNSQIVNCVGSYNTVSGISISYCKDCKITSCYAEHNGTATSGLGYGVGGNTIENCQIVNCNINYNNGYGIILSPNPNNNNLISGNSLNGNGVRTHNSYDNIYVSGYNSSNTANNNVIQNNICRRGSESNQSRYGININDPYTVAAVVANNDCYTGGTTAGIYNTGTGTNFGSGNRNNDGTWSTTPN